MIKKFVILILFVVLSIGCTSNSDKYLIDFGKDLSAQDKIVNSSELSQKPKFLSKELEKIRKSHLLDGISNENLSVQLKLPKGRYKIISYLEAGLTDSAYLKLFSNANPIIYNWQYFSPPAEGREKIQKMYRSISWESDIEQNPILLDFEGEKDSIRLLALFAIPLDKSFEEVSSDISEKLYEIGELNSIVTTKDIRNLLESSLLEENTPLNYYLKLRLEELALAIDLFDMMGWEKGTQIYGLSIFDRLHQCVMLLDGLISDNWIDKYLGDRTRWIRGRLLWWLNKERGGIGELEIATRDLNYLLERFPNNNLLQMYTGSKIDTPDKYDSLKFTENVPEWSRLQYEALGRLLSETKWWVEERQAENGEFGGKIGDDVELLRWWSALAAYGDKTTIKGWLKLGEAVWNNPKVYKGYSAKPIDVEHSSEFIADTYPEMIYFSNEDAKKYLEPSARYFKDLWTFKNENSRRFFKSSWFSSTEVLVDPPKDRDLSMNGRAVKAVRFYAWTTGDSTYRNTLYEWSSAWRDMALSNNKNKPIGVFPASVRGIDEKFNGDGKNWYDAEMFWQYFDWVSSGGVRFYDQLLYSYITHNDETLLLPLKKTLELVKKYSNDKNDFPAGSEGWAAKVIESKYRFWNTVIQYRILTQDKSFDDLIVKHGSPYSKFVITKNKNFIVNGLNKLLSEIRYNVPIRTSEVIHTDRVRVSDIITLKGMITGNDSYEIDSPFLALTYENTTQDITMLVAESNQNKIEIDFYSYSDSYLKPIVRPWLLKNGNYTITKYVDQEIVNQSVVSVNVPGERIKIELPPKKEVKFVIEKI